MKRLFKILFPFFYENPKLRSAFEKLFQDIIHSEEYADYCQEFFGSPWPTHNQMTLSQWQWLEERLGRESFKVLDFGCGTSPFMEHFKDQILEGSQGMDFSPNAIAWSKKHFEKMVFTNLNLEFLKRSQIEGPLDLVVSIDGLYNLSNRSDLFELAHQVLAKGGRFVLPWTLAKESSDPRISLGKLFENIIQKDFTLDLKQRWHDTIEYLESERGSLLKSSFPYLWKALYDEARINLELSPKRLIIIATK